MMIPMNPNTVGLLDIQVGDYLDVFRAAFIEVAERTLLPELCDLFGDKIIEFLNVFGGRTFTVPDRSVINKAIQLVDIYNKMKADPDSRRELAKTYDILVTTVDDIYDRMSQRLGVSYIEGVD